MHAFYGQCFPHDLDDTPDDARGARRRAREIRKRPCDEGG